MHSLKEIEKIEFNKILVGVIAFSFLSAIAWWGFIRVFIRNLRIGGPLLMG